MKKIIIILSFVAVISIFITIYLFRDNNIKAEAKKISKSTINRMVKELQKEQDRLEKEKQKLEQERRNLRDYETELNKKHDEYLQKSKELAKKEEDFNAKVEMRMVDRQTIETYESIDSEQAAILIKNLYQKDHTLATLIMRKISGKKAGKILEAMVPIDKEISTKIAEETLKYYRPE
jgi:flagellar motility protein MotE (MotC chaperone)